MRELGPCEQTYREANDRIPAYWRVLNRAAINTIKTGQPHRVGHCEFNADRDWMTITLPSGRQLFYRQPSVDLVPAPWDETTEIEQVTYWSVNSQTRKWEETRTYGGKLTENIVQAVARDFLVEAMLRVEAAGYPVILTVHDEIVAELEYGRGSTTASRPLEPYTCSDALGPIGSAVTWEGWEVMSDHRIGSQRSGGVHRAQRRAAAVVVPIFLAGARLDVLISWASFQSAISFRIWPCTSLVREPLCPPWE